MDLEKFGNFIKKNRMAKELTQEQLGKKLNVHPKTISKWERGINTPDISLLVPLSEALGVTVSELLNYQTNTDNTVKAIDYYTKKSKFQYFKIFSILFCFILILFLTFAFAMKYNEYKTYKIDTLNEDFHVQGFLSYNHDKLVLVMNEVTFIDKYIGTDKEMKIKDLNITLKTGNDIIYSSGYQNLIDDKFINLSSLLENVVIFVEGDNHVYHFDSKDLNNITMSLEYVDMNGEIQNSIIKLDLIKK